MTITVGMKLRSKYLLNTTNNTLMFAKNYDNFIDFLQLYQNLLPSNVDTSRATTYMKIVEFHDPFLRLFYHIPSLGICQMQSIPALKVFTNLFGQVSSLQTPVVHWGEFCLNLYRKRSARDKK